MDPILVICPCPWIFSLRWLTRWSCFFRWCLDVLLSSLTTSLSYPVAPFVLSYMNEKCVFITLNHSKYWWLIRLIDTHNCCISAHPSPSHFPSPTGIRNTKHEMCCFFCACYPGRMCWGYKQLILMCWSYRLTGSLPPCGHLRYKLSLINFNTPIYHLTINNYLQKCHSYPVLAFQLPLR